MKNQLDYTFATLKKRKKKALIAYLAAGYPSLKEETGLIKAMAESGVDILELGVPFSDPIADGPTIQFASQKALSSGITLKKILAWVRQLKKQVDLPIVLMSYVNPLLAYGLEKFAKDASSVGVSGVIIPDMIPEEGETIRRLFTDKGIHLIYLVAPTTLPHRKEFISKKTGGFLYAVSVTGVTGARRSFSDETVSWLKKLRQGASVPLCVGFGISGREQMRRLRPSVDGFIVGSALIDLIRHSPAKNRKKKLKEFIHGLAKECNHAA